MEALATQSERMQRELREALRSGAARSRAARHQRPHRVDRDADASSRRRSRTAGPDGGAAERPPRSSDRATSAASSRCVRRSSSGSTWCAATTRRSSSRCARRSTRSCRPRSSSGSGNRSSSCQRAPGAGASRPRRDAVARGGRRRFEARARPTSRRAAAWGEVQLGTLLAEALAPQQYAQNVETVPGTNERVEYAVKLPGRGENGEPCWLPIDCKFPLDELAAAAGSARARRCAGRGRARRKGLDEFLRGGGAEDPRQSTWLRRTPPTSRSCSCRRRACTRRRWRGRALADTLQREHRVDAVRARCNLAALLNSLQLGFRTLAIEQRSTEVWRVLGAVQDRVRKFGEVLAERKEKLAGGEQHARRGARQDHDHRAQAARRRGAARATRRDADARHRALYLDGDRSRPSRDAKYAAKPMLRRAILGAAPTEAEGCLRDAGHSGGAVARGAGGAAVPRDLHRGRDRAAAREGRAVPQREEHRRGARTSRDAAASAS